MTNFHVGVTDLNIEPVLKVSKDLFIYTERVTDGGAFHRAVTIFRGIPHKLLITNISINVTK